MDMKELFDAPVVSFPRPVNFSGPKNEIELLKKEFGEELENLHGVVQLATVNFKRVGERNATVDCAGYLVYPKARIPVPEMMERGREAFPTAHNFIFVIERPAEMKGKDKILLPGDFDKMAECWIKYAKKHSLPLHMRQFLGNPSSEHVMDIQVVMNGNTETDGMYGVHSYGLGCFIPLDEHTDPFPDTPETAGPPAELLKLLEMLAKVKGGVSPVSIPGDSIDAEFERLMKLPELPGKGGKGGKGTVH